ncbi:MULTISPECIES: DUF1827 family protein [Enterococcus]|uniref:DUF1827 family protein n=1 Tax=Candidatus Enterococcus ferrettii TaxID=2815324 RepID=A0ABV0EYT8_9ENTE|nr:DUF1827 family protein [Enterococcus sp. 665A]MBO1339893.1 DUF1827 family protein [Enterococcus sp. 665A]
MKLVNVTNSHSRLVFNQLENTDANMIKVYTIGNTTVIFTDAYKHAEIVIKNDKRNIQQKEIDFIHKYFRRKLKDDSYDFENLTMIEAPGLVEISITKKEAELTK